MAASAARAQSCRGGSSGRMNPVRAGAIALLIITVATWLAFTKSLPWRDPFQFHAVFQTSNDLRLDSPVRIAGRERRRGRRRSSAWTATRTWSR